MKKKTTDQLCSDFINCQASKRNAETELTVTKSELKHHKNDGKTYKFKYGSYDVRIVDTEALKRAGLYDKFTRPITRSYFTVIKRRNK